VPISRLGKLEVGDFSWFAFYILGLPREKELVVAHDMRFLFERIKAELGRNPAVTLRALTRKIGIDRHVLEKAVRYELDTSFRAYKQFKRLQLATNLIRTQKNLSLKEIAAMLGVSPNYLSRFISIATGQSPRKLRKDDLSVINDR
jgi:AraC-like DNA-binding protein